MNNGVAEIWIIIQAIVTVLLCINIDSLSDDVLHFYMSYSALGLMQYACWYFM